MSQRWSAPKWVRRVISISGTYGVAAAIGWAITYWFAIQHVGRPWLQLISLCGALIAVDLLRRWRRSSTERALMRRPYLACPRCGYDLKYNKGRCPECGAPTIASTGRFADVKPAIPDEGA